MEKGVQLGFRYFAKGDLDIANKVFVSSEDLFQGGREL
jgi:hypothetical protein